MSDFFGGMTSSMLLFTVDTEAPLATSPSMRVSISDVLPVPEYPETAKTRNGYRHPEEHEGILCFR